MNLLYIVVGGSTKITSVYKKVLGQINAFQDLGVESSGSFLSTHVTSEYSLTDSSKLLPIESPKSNFFYQLKLQKKYTKKIIELIQHSNADVIYIRYSFSNKALLKAICNTSKKIIIEKNTKALPELRNMQKNRPFSFSLSGLLSKIQNFYIPIWQERIYAKKVHQHCIAIVCVTKELSAYYASKNIRCFTITNGIETQNYSVREPTKNNTFIILILDGTSVNASWHGTERLINSIKKHQLEKEIEVRIAGNISKKYSESFITQLGFLDHAELEIEFNNADLGTGNLCLYKKGLKEASVLKNREYLTKGLPVLFAFNDSDIDDTLFINYCYKISNDNSTINLPDVINWCKNLKISHPKHPQEMNSLAKKNLDYRTKLLPLVKFLKS